MAPEVWSALSATVVARAASQLSRDAVIGDQLSDTENSDSEDDGEMVDNAVRQQPAQSKGEKGSILGTTLLQPDQPASPAIAAGTLPVLSVQQASVPDELQFLEVNPADQPEQPCLVSSAKASDLNSTECQGSCTEPMQGVVIGSADLNVLVKLPSGSLLPVRGSSAALLGDWKQRLLAHCGLNVSAEANFGLALGFSALDEGRSALSNDVNAGDVVTLFEGSH